MIRRAFFLRPRWAQLVLSGKKSLELRSRCTHVRETVGIIATGTTTVVGVCRIADCLGPLTDADLEGAVSLHQTTAEDRTKLRKAPGHLFAWVLRDVRRLDPPVPYVHVPGAQGWATIDPEVAGLTDAQLRGEQHH
jgi:hypothetical protein